jgi:hypothetical protein
VFSSFGLPVKDLASAITLLLPGFVAVSLFEAANPGLARHRQTMQWVMWSLTVSLLFYAAAHAAFVQLCWPHDPLDPEFYSSLLAASSIFGYVAGRLAGSEVGRDLTRRAGILIPPWVWVETMSSRRWVVVHLKSKAILYGYPRRFTDDPRENVRELYITNAMILSGEDYPRFKPFAETDGVLICSSEIEFVQFLEPRSASPDE